MVYRKDWGQPAQGLQGFARTMKAFGRKINLSAIDLGTTNNVVGAFMIPGGFMVFDWVGPPVPALGTALVLSIGDAGKADRYLAASTIGAAGGALPAMAYNANPLLTGKFFRTYTDTEVQILIATQSSAPVAGILELYMWGATV